MNTKVIRPDHDSENASPKSEVKKSNRVQPCREPQAARERMLLDPYLDLLAPRAFHACF